MTARSVLTVAALLSVSCVETEETERPPHVNVTDLEQPEAAVGSPQQEGGHIGVEVGANESDSLERLEVLPGVRVTAVSRDGPADAAGLRVGDVVLAVDGTTTDSPDAFEAVIRAAPAGRLLALEVRRGTAVLELRAEVRRRPAAIRPLELYEADPLRTRAGYRSVAVERDGNRRVVAEVSKVFPKSPFPGAGIVPGDRIVALDGESIRSAHDLVRRLIEERSLGDTVELSLWRDGEDASVEVTLWEPPRRLTKLAVPLVFTYTSSLRQDTTEFVLLDLWLLSFFAYRREGAETEYSFLTFFRFGTGYGELVDEAANP